MDSPDPSFSSVEPDLDEPTPTPSRKREGGETCRAAGEASRSGAGPAPRSRHDGWTRAKMVTFLRELAASQSVSQAALSVGMSRKSAYALRNKFAFSPFSLGWEVALEAGLGQLAQAVMDRALNGEEVPHYYHGELVATSRRYDNRLAAWLLANPWKVGRRQIAREHSSERWDALLELVETGPLEFPTEPAPGSEAALEPGEIQLGWYATEVGLADYRGRYDNSGRGG